MTARTSLTVVLAAGEGTRMRSSLPKVLHPVAGQALLAHVLNAACARAEANGAAVDVASAVDAIFPLLDADASGEVDRDELRAAFVKFEDPSMRLALGLGTSEADAAFERLCVINIITCAPHPVRA